METGAFLEIIVTFSPTAEGNWVSRLRSYIFLYSAFRILASTSRKYSCRRYSTTWYAPPIVLKIADRSTNKMLDVLLSLILLKSIKFLRLTMILFIFSHNLNNLFKQHLAKHRDLYKGFVLEMVVRIRVLVLISFLFSFLCFFLLSIVELNSFYSSIFLFPGRKECKIDD
jgi:hypothetical protein